MPCPLSSYEDFLAAYDCGGKGYRQTLSDYENEQKRLLEKKEENYRALVAGMERETSRSASFNSSSVIRRAPHSLIFLMTSKMEPSLLSTTATTSSSNSTGSGLPAIR